MADAVSEGRSAFVADDGGAWWGIVSPARHGAGQDLALTVAILAVATVVAAALDWAGLSPCIVIVYVFAVQICAFCTFRRVFCLLSSVAAVALFSFIFSEPRYALHIIDSESAGVFAVMFVASFAASALALELRRALGRAAVATRRAQMMLETNRMLQRCADESSILHAAGTQVARLAGYPCVWYRIEDDGDDLVAERAYSQTGDAAAPQLLAPEMPPFLSGSAYVGTPLDATFGGAAHYGVYLTVRSGDIEPGVEEPPVLGVLAVAAAHGELTADQLAIAGAIVSEAEVSLDRARAIEARERAAVLAKNEQMRANLLRSISHDLRTPLTSISGNADVLLDQGSTGTQTLDRETRRGLLKSIRSDAQWLNATVENLLAITKLEGGGMHLSPTLELMEDIIEEALRHVSPAVAEHEVKVVSAPEPALVSVDARLMVQLVVNLVNNAITYTPAGSHITLALEVGKDRVTLTVADDGPGIAPEDRARIFESFYTANHGLADAHRSVGLGLSLCRSIAVAHGGSIGAGAVDPHGTVFRVDLPAAALPDAEEDLDA